MPASMAACRTVLPLATVTCRPSIVSVTVSITGRSYPEASGASPAPQAASSDASVG